MATADYCDYKLSLALKAAGFDEPCDHYYTPNKAIRIVKDNALAPEITNNRFLDEIADGCCTAVSLWQAQKWLREKWGIHVDVCIYSDYSTDADGRKCDEWRYWASNIMLVETAQTIVEVDEVCDSYEQALSAGISAALELIKKGE